MFGIRAGEIWGTEFMTWETSIEGDETFEDPWEQLYFWQDSLYNVPNYDECLPCLPEPYSYEGREFMGTQFAEDVPPVDDPQYEGGCSSVLVRKQENIAPPLVNVEVQVLGAALKIAAKPRLFPDCPWAVQFNLTL